MPYYTARERKKATKRWTKAMQAVLALQRSRLDLARDQGIPDAVLLAETEHYFEPPDLWPVEQWFTRRLNGEADTDAQRQALAAVLEAELRTRSGQHLPWGLGPGAPMHRSRRGEPPSKPPS